MDTSSLEKRKNIVLAHETETARQLALRVIEKPRPLAWMILIPVLFVFYYWKLKDYEQNLNTFSQNSLAPWQKALEAVFLAEKSGVSINTDLLVDQFIMKREATRPVCHKWLTVLTGHFHLLLNAEGESFPELVRTAYLNKARYVHFCHQMSEAEAALNMSLLETIDGDSAELYQVTQIMSEGMKELRLQSAERIFS